MLAPALLPGLNSAEQQISPYQLRNASPQQLQRLRQMQEMQQLQRQQGGGPLTNLIGAFLPGGGQLLGGGLNPANNRLNGNNPNGQVGNQNPATLAQLLGLTPQQPVNNPYNQLSQLNGNGLQRGNVYGQPNARPNANLRRANPETTSNDASNNAVDNSADNGGEENSGDNSGNEDNSGDNSEGGNEQSNQQQDPSQDPDIQQFNNMNGNDGNFPGDLFPAGILSENDLKDIQKSMEEQAKKEAEKQRQQEQGNGEGEGEDAGNSEDGGEGSDQTNSDDQSNTNDQSGEDQSANQEEDANQTESPQDEANSELKDKNEPAKTADEPTDNGKLNVGPVAPKTSTGLTGNTILANKKPPTTNSYSYNSLRPNSLGNGIGNGHSNVQYEDDRSLVNNRPAYRPKSYVSNANLPASRNYNNLQRQRGQQDSYRTPDGYGRDRFSNDFRPNSRFNDLPPTAGNPFTNSYGSGVDYSPEYNQDPTGAGLYGGGGGGPGVDYNPMSNYRPNELLNNHVSRQHGDINNFNYNGLRPRTRNPLGGRNLERSGLGLANGLGNSLGNGLANDRSTVNYEPE